MVDRQPQDGGNDQQALWDKMHGRTDKAGSLVGRSVVTTPNDLAVLVADSLAPTQRVIEVGAANGRDARYWAKHRGALVLALDFSQVALAQLDQLSAQAGVDTLIETALYDASRDTLPAESSSADVFYARSSLHVDDARLESVLLDAHRVLRPGSLLAIEGKHPDDPKILRSTPVLEDSPHLVSDPFDEDHVRRVWEPDFSRRLLESTGFQIVELEVISDQTEHADPSIFTRILASSV
jgi:SAM-dependent methyltransferase